MAIKKTVIAEKDGHLLVRVDITLDLGAGAKSTILHEFWPSRKEFESEQKNIAEGNEANGELNQVGVKYNLTDEEAITLFESLN